MNPTLHALLCVAVGLLLVAGAAYGYHALRIDGLIATLFGMAGVSAIGVGLGAAAARRP